MSRNSAGALLSGLLCSVFLMVSCLHGGAALAGDVPGGAGNPASVPYVWDTARIGGGGFVSGLVVSKAEKGLIYARTDVGGAYRWNPADQSWIPLNDWVSEALQGYLGIESLALDPRNPDLLYMLAGTSYMSGGKTAILRSGDRGRTFEVIDVTGQFKAHGNGMGRQTGEKLQVDPSDSNVLYCGTRDNGLFRSTDRGRTWTRIASLDVEKTENGNGISFVAIDPASAGKGGMCRTIVAGVSRSWNNLWISRDAGATWTMVDLEPEMARMLEGEMPGRGVISSDGWLYVTLGNGAGPHAHFSIRQEPMDQGGLARYRLSDGTWEDISPIYRPMGGISIDPENPERLVACTINTWMGQSGATGDRIYLSDDAGQSWTDIFATWNEKDLKGITWAKGHSIHWAGSIEFDPSDTKRVFVVSGNGIWMTPDIGAETVTWNFAVKGLEETVPLDLVSIPGGPVLSVIGDYDGFVHTDPRAYAPIHNPQIGTSTGLAYAGANTKVVVRVGGDDKGRNFPLWYSEDQGVTWKRFASKPEGGNWYKGRVALSADGNVVLWMPEKSQSVYRTDNRGKTWTSVLKGPPMAPVGDPVDPKVFYSYQPNNGALLVSTDGGRTFDGSARAGRGGGMLARTVPGMSGHLWIPRNQGGITWTADGGKTFTHITNIRDVTALGLGKAERAGAYPAVYAWGTIGDVRGLYRSLDKGATWARVNDDAHQYGGPANGQFVTGDWNVFGRVWMSTPGRGLVFGEPAP